MPRIRSIKPEFWTDGEVLKMSADCALFYIALWNFCDDEGKIRNNPLEIKAQMGGRWDAGKVKLMLTRLLKQRRVRLSCGSAWYQLTNWSHQKIDRPRQPKIKAEQIQWFEESETSRPRRAFDEHSTQGSDRIGKDIALVDNTNVLDFKNQPTSTWLFEFSRSKDSQQWEQLIQNAFENKAPPEILRLTPKLAWLYRIDIETFRADLNDILSAKLTSEENRRKYLAVCIKKKLGLIAEKAAG